MPSAEMSLPLAQAIDALTSLTVGTNLFASHMPPEPAACVAIYEYGGGAPSEVLGGDGVEMPRVHVEVRGATYLAAHDLMRSVYDVVRAMTNVTLGDWLVYSIRPQDVPAMIRYDADTKLPIFGCNFQVWRS